MQDRRRSEDTGTKTFFRSERMIKEGNQWYFTTREGDIHGPFDTRDQASKMLQEYIDIMVASAAGKLTLAPRSDTI